jgi:carboxyl-terminal processing protease
MRTTLRLTLIGLMLAVVEAPARGGPAGPGASDPPKASVAARPQGDDKTYEQLSFLVDVLNYIQENYVDPIEIQKLVYGAAGGMVRTLDPFSQFMEPEANQEIKAETEGEFGGIGIRMIMKDDWLTVLTPLPDTPAYRAGMLPNDRIIEIDGESTKELEVADAMEKLRGAPGSKVRITIMRWPETEAGARTAVKVSSGAAVAAPSEEEGVEKEFLLSRENIKIESVQYRKLEGQIGYVRISEFSARTTQEFRDAMRELSRDGLSGLVLDLRFNPGGLLTSAVDVAGSFLGGEKLIVYTQGRRPDSHQEFRSGAQAPYQDLPLVLLVNGASASGSEIVAGALQDHRRALLLGERTYGKASVQSVIPLPNKCALRLTIAHYYTPNGRSIHRDEKKKTGGITPDVVIPVPHDIEDKIFAQWEMIYEPGKKPRSAVKKDETARDEVLDRAMALIKAGDLLGRLKGKDK